MISRVAEHCYWLHRYVERAENAARLLQVNHVFLLDSGVPESGQWWPLLRAVGEEERFADRVGTPSGIDGEWVQEYLTWELDNPGALAASVRQARENAHTIRETISLEMWEAVNTLWLWLMGGQARRLYERDRYAFYEEVKHGCQRFHGLSHTTMLYEHPFDFMRLGALLERADQTIRMLDTAFLRAQARTPAPTVDTPLWLATLRSCSAMESYFKRARVPVSGRSVGEFLIFDLAFPRSVAHCLERSGHFLRRIRAGNSSAGRVASGAAEALLGRLRAAPAAHFLDGDVHLELDTLLTSIATVGEGIVSEYFQGAAPALAMGAESIDA